MNTSMQTCIYTTIHLRAQTLYLLLALGPGCVIQPSVTVQALLECSHDVLNHPRDHGLQASVWGKVEMEWLEYTKVNKSIQQPAHSNAVAMSICVSAHAVQIFVLDTNPKHEMSTCKEHNNVRYSSLYQCILYVYMYMHVYA